jgi:hypothetical protein
MITPTGSGGQAGTTGHQGTSGPGGWIIDWKEDIQNKYHNRFTITTEYDAMTFAPTNTIIDKRTNKEYKLTLTSISDIMNETDLFIQQLIVTIRDKKINTIING